MELKNKLTVSLFSAMLAFTGLACGGEADPADTEVEIETPAEGGGLETEMETEMEMEPTEMETDMETEMETEMEMEPTATETS